MLGHRFYQPTGIIADVDDIDDATNFAPQEPRLPATRASPITTTRLESASMRIIYRLPPIIIKVVTISQHFARAMPIHCHFIRRCTLGTHRL